MSFVVTPKKRFSRDIELFKAYKLNYKLDIINVIDYDQHSTIIPIDDGYIKWSSNQMLICNYEKGVNKYTYTEYIQSVILLQNSTYISIQCRGNFFIYRFSDMSLIYTGQHYDELKMGMMNNILYYVSPQKQICMYNIDTGILEITPITLRLSQISTVCFYQNIISIQEYNEITIYQIDDEIKQHIIVVDEDFLSIVIRPNRIFGICPSVMVYDFTGNVVFQTYEYNTFAINDYGMFMVNIDNMFLLDISDFIPIVTKSTSDMFEFKTHLFFVKASDSPMEEIIMK